MFKSFLLVSSSQQCATSIFQALISVMAFKKNTMFILTAQSHTVCTIKAGCNDYAFVASSKTFGRITINNKI